MRKGFSLLLFSQIIIFCLYSNLTSQFYTLETENLRLLYFDHSNSYLVKHVARCFENSLRTHKRLFDYTPTEKISVMLHDFSDYGNAGAGSVPMNRINIAIAPSNNVYETVPGNERMNSTLNHEIVHIMAVDKSSKSDNFFRSIFGGKVYPTEENPLSMIFGYLTTPRRYSPRWYHEGIAVFMETWMAGGLGRALGAFDEMVFRTMVLENKNIYDLVGLESEGTKIDFQVGVNSYLYGTRFMSYLALTFGPESLLRWTSQNDGSKNYYISQFEETYKIPIETAWQSWINWEIKFQQKNLETIRTYPITEFQPISDKALGSLSRAYYDSSEKKIFAAINYPGQIPHIAGIDVVSGEIDKICNVKNAALYYVSSLAYDSEKKIIFFTTDNNDWRDILSVNVKTGEINILLKDARIGDLAFNIKDKSLWGIRHYNGISSLVRVPYPYKEWNLIYAFPYGEDIYDIDISPDGKKISAGMSEITGRQCLILLDVEKIVNEEDPYEKKIDFEYTIPGNFVFDKQGRYLYGSTYYSGVSNIYRLDVKSDSLNPGEMILSNCESGFFRATPFSKDSLIVFKYTTDGFLPGKIQNKLVDSAKAANFLGWEIYEQYPIVGEWIAGSPGKINIDSLVTFEGEYSGFSSLQIASMYPVVEGFKDFVAYGLRIDLSDPVGIHNIDFTASYSPYKLLPENQRLHFSANYSYFNWNFNTTYNYADFYDLFGPTKTSMKGYSIGIQYDESLLFDPPRKMGYIVNLNWFGNLERLPDYQNIAASFNEFLNFKVNYNYQSMRASLGAVDYEKGFKFDINSNNNYVNKKIIPRLYSNFHMGFPLPINHSSIWLRASGGYSFGDREDPFANFFFGGFGNNYIDSSPEKRYREYYSFPGIKLNNVGGTNYGKLLFEWNLPPLRLGSFGFPSSYITWIRTSMFSNMLLTNFDKREYLRKLVNLGVQVDFKLIVLSHLKFTLSFGYAQAFEENLKSSEEFMFSLKIM